MKIRGHQALVAILLAATMTTAVSEVIYGIGSHMGQGRTSPVVLMNWLKQSGFTSFRDEIYWGDVERSPNVFEPSTRAQAALSVFNKSAASGMTPLVVLDYGNKFYDGGDQPYSDEGRAGFARYSQYIAKVTDPNIKLFEIWNEWNIGSGAKPARHKGSSEDYVKLVAAASKAIHAFKPGAQIIAGSLADDLGNWPWLQEAIKYGLLKYADGISVHMYNYLNPLQRSGDAEFMERLHQLDRIIKLASPSKPIKIYVTEIGWPNHQGRGSVSPEVAAANAVRFLFSSKEIDSIAGIWFYELQDGGTDPNEKEHHFGFLTKDGSEKPISCAVGQIVPLLKNYSLASSEESNGIKKQTFKNAEKQTLTAVWKTDWTDNTKKNITITAQSNPDVIDTSCKREPMTIQKKTIQTEATQMPTLLRHTGELSLQK